MSFEVNDVYKNKYVAFLDLLGFKSKVNDADTNHKVQKEILNVLDIFRDTLCNSDNIGMRFTHFSDCIIFSVDRTSRGLWEILESINVLTLNLLNYDFFIRGGLSAGGIYHDEKFVYGSAVNRAYKIENKESIFPITLVSNEVIADIKSYSSTFEEFLIQDAEGRYFVHYLKSYAEYTRLPAFPGKVLLDESGKRIIDFICHRLNTHIDPKIREKDIWFQNYWNKQVAIRGVFGCIEEGVTNEI